VHPAPGVKRVRMTPCVSIHTTVETAPNGTAAPRLHQTAMGVRTTPSPSVERLRGAGVRRRMVSTTCVEAGPAVRWVRG
jgi:hypothetical protein